MPVGERRLEGRVIIVTGGATGIGLAVAERCVAGRARVAIIDTSPVRGGEAVAALGARGASAHFYVADVASEEEVVRAVCSVEEDLGRIAGLVNNAGIVGIGAVHDTPRADWDRIMAVNATGTFLVSKAVLPSMLRGGGGSIVNIASIAGVVGISGMAAYCAAKGAVVSLTRQMAADYSGKGIRVNVVCPGTVGGTDMGRRLLGADATQEQRTQRLAKYPIGRFGEAEEVAAVAYFLLSDDASFVTGAVLTADGGMTAI